MNTTTNLFLQPCDESTRNELNNHIKSNYFFVDVQPIGKSVLGRAIECYTIGNSSKKILLCGAFHGMEWITSFVLSASHVVGYILLYAANESVDGLDGRPCVVGRCQQTVGISERIER